MPIKSCTFQKTWWIPKSEIGQEKPTAFLISQMAKKEFDINRHKSELEMISSMVTSSQEKESIPNLRLAQAKVSDSGFSSDIYRKCVHEIRNVYVGDDFKEVLTKEEDIINFIAGMEDQEIGNELDDAIWRRSTLERFEEENFTPTSGCNSVCRTKETIQTASNASTVTTT